MHVREATALEQSFRHRAATAALTVDDDFAALVAELIHPAGELLHWDADSAVDVPSLKLSRAADIEKHCTLRDEVAGGASRDAYRGETQVEHGRYDDYQDD